MGKQNKVRKYTDNAIADAQFLSREEYKKIKHMNHVELAHYIKSAWDSGYYSGLKEAERRAAEDKALDAAEPEQMAGKLENADAAGVSEEPEAAAEAAEQVGEDESCASCEREGCDARGEGYAEPCPAREG